MRLVVCDTGPILHLSEAGCLDLLHSTGTVAMPSAVAEELDTHIPAWGLSKPNWIRVNTLSSDAAERAAQWEASGVLHAGEAESLALAQQLRCDWYLTDDAAARIFASSLGLEVHGTLGVVLWSAATGNLGRPDAESVLDRLANHSSLWVSPRILAEAKSALDALCSV